MFTGLIQQQGLVVENRFSDSSRRLFIEQTEAYDERVPFLVGESIAVNGVCLTLLPPHNHVDTHGYATLAFDISPETLQKTNLARLCAGEKVHLERALLASDRFGGHYVTGHVDKTLPLLEVNVMGEYIEMTIGFETDDRLHFLPKGSVTLDGVSLTINEVGNQSLNVMLIPHTLDKTQLGFRQPGYLFNVEFDYLTRVIAHQLRCLEVIA